MDVQELFDHIRQHIHQDPGGLREHLDGVPAADLAELLNRLTVPEAAAVMSLLPLPRATRVFEQPTLQRRSALLEHLEPSLATQIMSGLPADQRVAILRA